MYMYMKIAGLNPKLFFKAVFYLCFIWVNYLTEKNGSRYKEICWLTHISVENMFYIANQSGNIWICLLDLTI